MHRFPTLLLAVLALVSCGERATEHQTVDTAMVFTSFPPPAPGAPVLRISIVRDGKVYADGRVVTYAVLDSLLAALKNAHGEVWLHEEVTGHQRGSSLDSALMKVGTAIARLQLPNRFSSRADFSDLKSATHH